MPHEPGLLGLLNLPLPSSSDASLPSSTPSSPETLPAPAPAPEPLSREIPSGGSTPKRSRGSSGSLNRSSRAGGNDERAFRVPSPSGPDGSQLANYRSEPLRPPEQREREVREE